MRNKLGLHLGILILAVTLSGCDPLTVHKITSTVFDGVPSMPPAEEYCQDYHERKLFEEKESALKKQSSLEVADAGSSHRPYREKKCADCHDKSTESGLIKPKDEVCFVCHPKILKGEFQHGPAAVGSCLECHEPHSSNYKALLKVDKGKVCFVCHKEQRLAANMHQKVSAGGLFCSDCHDPHAGPDHYFLR